MQRLETRVNGFNLYNAGLPGYPHNFSRDGIVSFGIINPDPLKLRYQLSFGSETIAT